MKCRSRISVSLSDELIELIDKKRGLIKRSTYVEMLIRKGLVMKEDIPNNLLRSN